MSVINNFLCTGRVCLLAVLWGRDVMVVCALALLGHRLKQVRLYRYITLLSSSAQQPEQLKNDIQPSRFNNVLSASGGFSAKLLYICSESGNSPSVLNVTELPKAIGNLPFELPWGDPVWQFHRVSHLCPLRFLAMEWIKQFFLFFFK